jgi:threonylcarbamoyladenosine tRNA methylthiotransferase MtaB
MRRRYTQDAYRDAVRRLRVAVPDVAITTDVIVGFPGETEAEFEESFAFCREMQFAGIHVFPYSQRSGTVAFKLPGQVPDAVKKQRVHRLIGLANRVSAAYRARFLGRTATVLWESPREGVRDVPPVPSVAGGVGTRGVWEGLTDTYIRVRTESAADLTNRLTPALLVEERDGVVWAQIPEEVT